MAEPAIIPVEELEGEEKLEVLDSSADPFFSRTSYNRGDFFLTAPPRPKTWRRPSNPPKRPPPQKREKTPRR